MPHTPPGVATNARTPAISARIVANKVVIPNRNASAITIKATPAVVMINGKIAVKVARRHVTKNGEPAGFGVCWM